MATILKKMGLSAGIAFALFLGINSSIAQEQAVKVADATQLVSAVKVVKPVIAVPAALAKAMAGAKGEVGGKPSEGKGVAPIKLLENYWFRVSGTTIESTPVSEDQLETELCDLPFSAGRPVCAVAFASETELTEPPTTDLEETSVIDPQNGEPVAAVRYKEPQ